MRGERQDDEPARHGPHGSEAKPSEWSGQTIDASHASGAACQIAHCDGWMDHAFGE